VIFRKIRRIKGLRHAPHVNVGSWDKRLALHNSDDLNDYLNVLGRNSSWQGWQLRQAVGAIELLLRKMVHLPSDDLISRNLI